MPSRILHLVDGVRPLVLDELLRDRPQDVVLRLGGQDASGEGGVLRLPTYRLLPGRSDGGLGRFVRNAGGGVRFSVVHGWGTAAVAAIGRLRERVPVVMSLDRFDPGHPLASEATDVVRSGRGRVITTSRQLVRALNSVRTGNGRAGNESVICPAVPTSVLGPRRDACRARWGATPSSLVLGVLPDSEGASNLQDLAGVAIRCALLGRQAIMVSSSRGTRRGQLVKWLESIENTVELVFDDAMDDLADVARSLDVALVPGITGAPAVCAAVEPVMTAVAADLPVILGRGHPAADWTDDFPAVFPAASQAEHAATRWLMNALEMGTDSSARAEGLSQLRIRSLIELYGQAVSRRSAKRVEAASR